MIFKLLVIVYQVSQFTVEISYHYILIQGQKKKIVWFG